MLYNIFNNNIKSITLAGWEVICIELKERQQHIIEIVKQNQPITSTAISEILGMSRAAIRPDLSILTMSGILVARPKVGYFYNGDNQSNELLEAIEKVKVGDVYSMPTVANEKASVYDTIVTMFLEDVGSIFVLSNGYLAGVVSRKDFLKTCIGGTDIHNIPVGVIMTRMPNVIVAFPNEPVYDAAKRIIEHQIDSMPVVEKKVVDDQIVYKVLGKLSKTTITQLFVDMGKD